MLESVAKWKGDETVGVTAMGVNDSVVRPVAVAYFQFRQGSVADPYGLRTT